MIRPFTRATMELTPWGVRLYGDSGWMALNQITEIFVRKFIFQDTNMVIFREL